MKILFFLGEKGRKIFILTEPWICFQEDQAGREARGSERGYLVDLCETQSL